MQTIQGARLATFRAARAFLAAHVAHLPAEVIALCARLDATILDVERNIAVQEASAIEMKMASRRYQALRDTLVRSHIGPLVKIAQLEIPAAVELAALKRPSGNRAAHLLAASATGLAKAAKPYHAALVAGGLRPDFSVRLDAAVAAMLEAFGHTLLAQSRRRGATTGLRTELARARKIVDAIASMLHEVFIEQPSLADDWASVKRVHAPVKRTLLSAAPETRALEHREVKRLYSGGDEQLPVDDALDEYRAVS